MTVIETFSVYTSVSGSLIGLVVSCGSRCGTAALDLDGDRTQQYSLDRRFRAWDKGDGTCRQGFLFLDERDYMHQPSKVKGAHVVRITPKIVNYTFADVWHRVDFEEQRVGRLLMTA